MSAPYTIVLVHGLTIVRDVERQFIGVPEALLARGYRVRKTLVKGGGTLTELAERVWRQIELIDGPLVLLCHSMGGLQARTFLLDDARAQRIRAIVTVGSPHEGFLLPWLATPLDAAYREFRPSTRQQWLERNGATERRAVERFGVRCHSVIARLAHGPNYRRLIIPHRLVERLAGPNDGLVPAAAQRWGKVEFEVDLDHMECACVLPPSRRESECVNLWVRMAKVAEDSIASSTG